MKTAVKSVEESSRKPIIKRFEGGGRKTATYLLAAVLCCLTALAAQATRYYWKGTAASDEAAEFGNWSDLSNWSTEGETGADATALPGSSDDIYAIGDSPYRKFDLENSEWSISGWASNGDWNKHRWRFRNGTLHWTGSWTTHSDHVYLDNGANFLFDAGSVYLASDNHGAEDHWYVNSGATLSMLGELRIYKLQVEIADGGTVDFNPSSVKFWNSTAQSSFIQNNGTLNIPGGYSFLVGSGNAKFAIRQQSGTISLGGALSKNNMAGTYSAEFSGGTIRTTGDVSFDLDSVTVANGAALTLEMESGSSIDLSPVSYGTGAAITKTGAGDFLFSEGMPLPDTFTVAEGSILLASAGSYDISGVSFESGGSVKIGAAGVTLTGWDASLLTAGAFVSGIASPVAGSTLLACADADVLALAKTGLDSTLPEGFAVKIDGNNLVATSAYVFDSTTVTDLNDATGWAGGSVPVGKVVTIMGAGVAPTTAALPEFAGITIQDGASLTVSGGATLPATTIAGASSLTLASGTFDGTAGISFQASGSSVPSLTVASGATLNVAGGSIFTDCSLSVSGTLAATTSGDLVLGYAASGATSSFGLTVNGGTISHPSGHVNFFCPASGGTVSPLGDVVFTGATFVHDDNGTTGFNFCQNNPSSTTVNFVFDGTTLNYPLLSPSAGYAISGGANLFFRNGGSLYRADNSGYNHCLLNVTEAARIVLEEGTVSKFGMSANGGSAGNGYIKFAPDTDGYASLVVSNASWEARHSEGNSKAVAEIYGDSAHPFSDPQSWNRKQPFNGFKAVNLNSGATLSITNDTNSATLSSLAETFTGAGSLFVSTPRSTTRTFNFTSTSSTATGTLSADASKPTALVIAPTAAWGGTVVWNGKASIDHTSAADSMTFGGIDLASDFSFRIWADGVCDHYTLTGDGFVNDGGQATVLVMDGSEAAQGDEWVLARVPAGSYVPTIANTAWSIASRAVDGDDTVVDIVLSPVVSDYIFESDTISDLSDAGGWATGSVPSGQDVKIVGTTTVAIVSDAETFPSFSSIAVRNGATLKVLADVTLPPLTIDSTSKVVFGDGVNAVSATLDATLVTACDASTDPVSLPVIEVATNATLTVASGMKFKNVDFRLYGAVTKALDDYTPVFGYAENGETSYFALTVDGGTFGFHSDQNADKGAVSIVCPASGGTVVPVGTVTLRNASRPVSGWADFGDWAFGVNNPTNVSFEVLVDGTAIDCSAYFYASGAANLSLVNGSCIRRNGACGGHWFPMAIQNSATVSVGDGCYVDMTTGNGSFGIDSQTAVDSVTVRDGGIYAVTYNTSGWQSGWFVSDGGVLGVKKLYDTGRARSDLLLGFAGARLDGDLTVQSLDFGMGTYDWERRVKFTDKPISGTGNVTVTNGVPAYPFTVTVVNGSNTATGSIKVDRQPGDVETALYFADGANWAGTVVAGDVALTNLTTAAAAATATFATLDLASGATFPVRVWKDGSTVSSSDTLNVGAYANNGGKLAFEMQTDGQEFGRGDTVTIGTIGKSSALPKLGNNWIARTAAIDGDEDNLLLTARYSLGFQIILR